MIEGSISTFINRLEDDNFDYLTRLFFKVKQTRS